MRRYYRVIHEPSTKNETSETLLPAQRHAGRRGAKVYAAASATRNLDCVRPSLSTSYRISTIIDYIICSGLWHTRKHTQRGERDHMIERLTHPWCVAPVKHSKGMVACYTMYTTSMAALEEH
jgi:hypothetical protein